MLQWISGARNEAEDTTDRVSSLCGYLWKMKRSHQKMILVPQWNKRWFSIEGRLLKWYAVASSDHSSGMVDLRFITNVAVFEAQGVFSFILSYPDRNILLRAANASDMNKWIRALQFQADVARGGCGMTIVTASNTSGSNPQGKGRALKEKYRPATLEANLEATMVRLQILESNVMKQSYKDNGYKENEYKDNGYGGERERERAEREKENAENINQLRPEDVRLFESTRAKQRTSRDNLEQMVEERDSGRDGGRGHRSGQNGHDSGYNHRSDHRNDENGRSGYSYQERNGDDREYNSRDGRERSSDSGDGKQRRSSDDKMNSWMPANNNRNHASSDKAREAERENEVSQSDKRRDGSRGRERGKEKERENEMKLSPREDIEEIMPVPRARNKMRARGQVQAHGDRERERQEGEAVGASSGSSSSRSGNSRQNNANRSGMPPSVRQGNWGYDDEETYRDNSEFEGGVSRRQSMALTIAAGRAANNSGSNMNRGSGDNGGSGRNSRSDSHEGPDYDDLPEMDLTVRKPNQRVARERKQERDREQQRVDRSSNGNGWV